MAKSRMVAIGDSPMVTGFKLGGLEEAVIINAEDFQKTLESYLDKSEYGIIIVNEPMFLGIDWKLKKRLDSLAYPVIIPVPDLHGASAQGDEIKSLIKRALGFDITEK